VVDGQAAETRTRKATVAGFLSEAGIALAPEDRVEPPPDTPLTEDTTVRVVRIREGVDTVEETIPKETLYEDDPNMDQGDYLVLQAGADGLIRRSYRVVYEDGQEAKRELLEESEVQSEPEIVARGTRPVKMVETPAGPLRYRDSLNVFATWYNPASAGRPPESPWYGIAATGVPVHRGIVAVDPSVIPLGSRMYVPGYGEAVAADTGWAVVGNIIDLGFADYEQPDWGSGWVEIYILE
jgi:3D (Asp-Asp-Asp) domain-containing protein